MKIDWINEDFYSPEYRDGFYVPSERKKIWAIELDLLVKFIAVCNKYGLSYFLNGGSLLGAIRHGGFIPWDDDIDVMMPRKDFERLSKIAGKEFTFPYFFQTPLTDKRYFRAHAQLRNSLTTGCTEEDAVRPINRGIFIDIFILDSLPSNKFKRICYQLESTFLKKICVLAVNIEDKDLGCVQLILKRCINWLFKFIPYSSFYTLFQKSLAQYKEISTEDIGEFALGFKQEGIWKRVWFSSYFECKFEMLTVRVPQEYKKVLETQYGQCWQDIPVECPPSSLHGRLIISTEVPYEIFFGKST